MRVVIGYFVGDQPMRKFVAHTVVRSRKNVLGCWVGRLQPGLFVHRVEGGLHIAFGWLADWSAQLHSHSEASCWLYNFPTFTCARPSKRPERIYTTCVWLSQCCLISAKTNKPCLEIHWESCHCHMLPTVWCQKCCFMLIGKLGIAFWSNFSPLPLFHLSLLTIWFTCDKVQPKYTFEKCIWILPCPCQTCLPPKCTSVVWVVSVCSHEVLCVVIVNQLKLDQFIIHTFRFSLSHNNTET